MTENERVREVRKAKGLTMEKFGEKLGVQKTAISKIESGDRSVTDQMRRAICREFDVNEEWLRDGTGDMFKQGYSEQLTALAAKYQLPQSSVVMIDKFCHLSPEDQQRVYDYFVSVVESTKGETLETSSEEVYTAKGTFPASIDEEVEDYRRQLEQEKRAGEGSGASQDIGA